jgi:membrane-associated phospholipid phosphatase
MEIPWRDRRAPSRLLLEMAAAAAALSVICMVFVDRAVARAMAPYEPLPFWEPILDALDYVLLFPIDPHALPVLLVGLMLIAMVVPRLRGLLPGLVLVAGVHVITRYATGWIKDLTGRLRPKPWLASGADDTFGWIKGDAFPSGHVVLWASILIPLAVLFPRLRPLLVVVVFVACARVGVNAHWVSDTIGAIALVLLVTWLIGVLVRPLRPLPP